MAPPGQIDMSTIPSLIGPGRLLNEAIVKAMAGNNIIWHASPIIRAFGAEKIFLKSPKLRESPSVIIIRARVTGRIYCEKRLASIDKLCYLKDQR